MGWFNRFRVKWRSIGGSLSLSPINLPEFVGGTVFEGVSTEHLHPLMGAETSALHVSCLVIRRTESWDSCLGDAWLACLSRDVTPRYQLLVTTGYRLTTAVIVVSLSILFKTNTQSTCSMLLSLLYKRAIHILYRASWFINTCTCVQIGRECEI